MRGCFTIHYNGETSPGSTPRSERLKPFSSGLRKVCDISIRLRHRTPSNPWVQDVLQWRVFEALLYSVRTDLRLADPAVTIFNACSSSVLKFRCFSCTVLTKLRDKLCNSTIFLRAIHIPLCVNCLLTWMTSHMSYLLWLRAWVNLRRCALSSRAEFSKDGFVFSSPPYTVQCS